MHFPWQHKWKAVASRHETDVSFGWPGIHSTKVVYHCGCGKVRQESFNGHWDFEDLVVEGENDAG